jgi:hypothetical protein
MERYIGQKAQQALEALGGVGSLRQRLKSAKGHFALVNMKEHLVTMPPQVGEAIKTFMEADVETDIEPDLLEASRACQTAIELIFSTLGREEISHESRAN